MRTLDDGREICETDEEWKIRRIEVWKRDGGRCRDCGRIVAPTLSVSLETHVPVGHVHHIKPRSLGRDDREQNLLLLCARCHVARG